MCGIRCFRKPWRSLECDRLKIQYKAPVGDFLLPASCNLDNGSLAPLMLGSQQHLLSSFTRNSFSDSGKIYPLELLLQQLTLSTSTNFHWCGTTVTSLTSPEMLSYFSHVYDTVHIFKKLYQLDYEWMLNFINFYFTCQYNHLFFLYSVIIWYIN